jgi:hypothetical protein
LYQSEDCVMHGFKFLNEVNKNDAFELSHWNNDDKLITYFIPMIEDENELNIFLLAPYPPMLIGPYDFIAMADHEYDLMTNRLRHQILKASHHARIQCQIGINKIAERN